MDDLSNEELISKLQQRAVSDPQFARTVREAVETGNPDLLGPVVKGLSRQALAQVANAVVPGSGPVVAAALEYGPGVARATGNQLRRSSEKSEYLSAEELSSAWREMVDRTPLTSEQIKNLTDEEIGDVAARAYPIPPRAHSSFADGAKARRAIEEDGLRRQRDNEQRFAARFERIEKANQEG